MNANHTALSHSIGASQRGVLKRVMILAWLPMLALTACVSTGARQVGHDFSERGVLELQTSMERGDVTSRDLVEYYLARIESLDANGPTLKSIIEVNPEALAIADALDRERRSSGSRGPLHGIPVVLKANIDTGDTMATSAGSLALANHRAPDDAFLVARLREAGAVILGKTNMSEWANFRSSSSSSGWSSLGGQAKNPYDPRRNPCGSSSGSGVAVSANFATLAVGTETDGSIVCPSGANGVVGIKPTLGLVSRDGIIPIAHSQDTAGPMTRTVTDAALLLQALAAKDAADPAAAARGEQVPDYSAALDVNALRGKRIGVVRSYSGADGDARITAILDNTIRVLQAQGAEVVDALKLDTEDAGEAEFTVLKYEFKADLNAYLQASKAPFGSLAEIIAFNQAHADTVMPIFGQDLLEDSQKLGPLTEAEYLEALEKSGRIVRGAIDQAMTEHRLDALIAPTNGPAWLTDHVLGDNFSVSSSSLAAVSGYPAITVPAGYIAELPIGMSFIGAPFSEAKLIGVAYAFEQASKVRKAPRLGM